MYKNPSIEGFLFFIKISIFFTLLNYYNITAKIKSNKNYFILLPTKKMQTKRWWIDDPEPGGGARQKLKTKSIDTTLLSTLSSSRVSDWVLYDVKAHGKKYLIDSLYFTRYPSLYPLPKRIKTTSESYRPKYKDLIKPIYIRWFEREKTEENKIYIKKVIETLKLWELTAKLEDDIDRQKEYHKMVVDLYLKLMKDVSFAPTEYTKRKEFFSKMSPHEFEAYAIIHKNKIFELYSTDPATSNVSDTDSFRRYLWEDVWVSADDNQLAASYLYDEYCEYLLENNVWVWNNTIKLLAWWAWSGKSSISAFPECNSTNFSWVFDWTLKTYKKAESLIERIKERWYDVRVEFVYRGMTEAFIHGVLERTIKQNQYFKAQWKWDYIWRTVPLDKFESWHKWARNTVLKLYEKYWSKMVKFFWWLATDLPIWNWVIDKVAGSPWEWPKYIYEFDIEFIKNMISKDVLDIEKCKLAVEEALLKWKISATQKKALLWKYL